LGAMFVGVLAGISLLLSGLNEMITAFIGDVNVLTGGEVTADDLGISLWNTVSALDWSDPLIAAGKMVGKGWLGEALAKGVNLVTGVEYVDFAEEIELAAQKSAVTIKGEAIGFLAFCISGFIAGFVLTRYLIRKNVARRSLWKSVLFTIMNAVLTSAVAAISVFLSSKWLPGSFISVIATMFLADFIALFEAYVLFGRKKVAVRRIVNAKNLGGYIFVNAMIFAISCVLILATSLINPLVGVFVGLTVVTIAFSVIGVNAESYVVEVVKSETEIS
ncbi:MAG: hypothetical protein ACI4SK_04980, partial [Christensenellales bacterium]